MPRKKPGLTFEEHVDVGNRLRFLRSELVDLMGLFYKSYPASHKSLGRPHKFIVGALSDIDNARCYAEENLFKDCPDRANFDIYYGGKPYVIPTDDED